MSRRLVFPLAAVAALALAAFIFLGVGNPLSTAGSESVEQTGEPTLTEAPEPVEEEADEEASGREAEQEAEAEQQEAEREAEAEEQAAAEEEAAEEAAAEEQAAEEQAAAEQAAAEEAAAEEQAAAEQAAAEESAALEQAAAEEAAALEQAAAEEAAVEEAATEEAAAEEAAATEEVAAAPPASGDLSLTVPKMGRYNDPVFNTESEEALHHGAIKLPSTGFPWEPGSNTYIAAHVYGYEGTGSWQQFAGLPSMTYGDEILLTDANGTTYEYEVTEIMTVMPTDVWVAQPEPGRDMVSLQTCVGPGWSERLVVRADRV